jgi:hypothetical protein
MSEHEPIQVDDDYDVGYGKPPKHTRFKKGKSGNPKGRPRRFAFEDDEAPLRRYLLEPMTVIIKGKKTVMPTIDVIIKSMIHKAIQGCLRTQKLFIQESGGLTALREEAKRVMSGADQEYVRLVQEKAKEWLA